MPGARKELHYFDENFERGRSWYASWFTAGPAQAVGEITPHYMYDRRCIARIKDAGITRLLVILRDPVERAISHHQFRNRVDGTSMGFDEFLAQHPEAVEWGRYASHLGPWVEAFGLSSICVLRFEHAVADVDETLRTLGAFLDVDPRRFPEGTGHTVINDGGPARHPRAHALAKRVARRSRRADARWVGSLARRSGLERVLRARSSASPVRPPAEPGAIARLRAVYEPEIERLERLLGWDLSDWRGGL